MPYSLRLPARLVAGGGAAVHVRGRREVGKGAVVSLRFAGAERRGVVVGLEESAARGREGGSGRGRARRAAAEPLVDLALWLADYYGSTPARALELVAPPKRKARGERPQPAERGSLGGEAEPAQLSEKQERALARIVEALEGGGGNVLLHGATGSGKTEVYLQACAAALERGKGAIVLVPEIALAPQTRRPLPRAVRRPRRRPPLVAHGGRAAGRARADRRAGRRGSSSAPARRCSRRSPSLGVICVDEEHDASYKQESDPRYDARTVAAKRAALEGAVAIFGTATPRPESWERWSGSSSGAVIAAPLPPVRVVDLRREAGYPLSAPLLAELGGLREDGGKAILLLNRRGVAPALHCRACGRPAAARIATSRSSSTPTARSAATTAAPRAAPARRALLAARPSSRASARGRSGSSASSRSTCPSSSGSGSTPTRSRSPRSCARRCGGSPRADRAVLVGTQMVAKGHHFAGVELAAVVDADTGLGAARLPSRGANVPARDPARGPERPGRARPRDRPDVPAGARPS